MYRSIFRAGIFASLLVSIALLSVVQASAQSAPVIRIDIPERFRVLTDQYFDLRVEAAGIVSPTARLTITIQNDSKSGREQLKFDGALETNISSSWRNAVAGKRWNSVDENGLHINTSEDSTQKPAFFPKGLKSSPPYETGCP